LKSARQIVFVVLEDFWQLCSCIESQREIISVQERPICLSRMFKLSCVRYNRIYVSMLWYGKFSAKAFVSC
jgi:hypothetical protein